LNTQPDSDTAIATPDLDAVIRKMDQHLEQFARERDPRERFLLMYRTFKNQLRRNVRCGRFLDAEWSEAICCRMAETYFEALEHYRSDDGQCPECWERSFNLSLDNDTNLLQDALLGMNAHINYDLTISTFDTLLRFNDLQAGSSPGVTDRSLNRHLKRRYYDYLMINQIAWESIPLIQDVLTERFSRLLGVINRLSFRVSRYFMEKVIMDYRDRAWGHVLLMVSVDEEQEMRYLRTFMDMQAVRNIQKIITGLSWNPLVLVRGAVRGFPLGEVKLDATDYRNITNMFLSKLEENATSSYAYRALVEYGMEAEPALLSALDDPETSEAVRRRVIRILAEFGTPDAISGLLTQLGDSNRKLRTAVCAEIGEIELGRRLDAGNRQTLRQCIDSETEECLALREQARAFEFVPGTDLIYQTLVNRYSLGQLRLLALLWLYSESPDRAPDRSRFHRKSQPPTDTFPETLSRKLSDVHQTLLQKVESVFVNVPGQRNSNTDDQPGQPESDRWQEYIERYIRGDDPWLRLCAASAALEQGWKQYYGLISGVLSKNPGFRKDLGIPSEWEESDPAKITIYRQEGNTHMISTIEKVLHLKNVPLFNEIPAEDLTQVARLAGEREFRTRDYLIREGEDGKELFILLEGEVEVQKSGIEITTLDKGAVLGEMSILSESATTADCIAKSKVRALTIKRRDFRRLLYGEYPEIAIGLLQVLTERLEETTKKAERTEG